MKQSGLKAKDKVIFTVLFNSIANGPREEKNYRLRLANELRNELKHENFPLTPINYHAMIKGILMKISKENAIFNLKLLQLLGALEI